ncbi:translation initiation factor [Planctomicrobium sp. SH527]|uniref:translation initiation factor n=1 Tax=Planctomicrobium sp. SH527 TaxID=3448123 RepID=UPI003F5C6807
MGMFSGTQFDRPPHCAICEKLESECTCPPPAEVRTPPGKQTLKLALERRKGGRNVTTIRGLVDEGTHIPDLLTLLKSTCGAGGTIQEGIIELQGEQREKVKALLSSRGYKVK